MNDKKIKTFALLLIATLTLQINAQDSKSIEGRWNLTLSYDGKDVPSWLEVSHSGLSTLVGRFVFF